MEIGISSLSDVQHTTVDRRHVSTLDRVRQIVDLGVRADELGLDVMGVGEHHSPHFAVSSPVVVLAAIAARTARIRLTSAVTVLSTLDPVRVYQDFASLDLISAGRAELTVGRSAYPDPFALFGVDLTDYEELFVEKLDLLLRVREEERTTWSGRFRPSLRDAAVEPRAVQEPLPVWIGVGGSPESAARAGRLGLPMILGYLGGSPHQLKRAADVYRSAGDEAGHPEKLQLGVALHYYGADRQDELASVYPHYRDFLRPKDAGGPGFVVTPEQFALGVQPDQALMMGTPDYVAEKLVRLHEVIGVDRVLALVDWGGLPLERVNHSVELLAAEIAPMVRAATNR